MIPRGRTLAALAAALATAPVVAAEPGDPAAVRERATAAAARGTELAASKRYGEGAAQFAIAVDALESAGLVHDGDLASPDAKAAVKYYFAWAELERYSGNCACAVALYKDLARRFGATSEVLRRSTEDASAQCANAEPNRGSCRDVAAPLPTPIVIAAPPPAPPAPPPWWHDARGGGLALAGLVAAVSGGLFVHAARADAATARTAGIGYDQYTELAHATRRDEVIGAIALGASGALLGLAAWRYHAVSVSAAATPDAVAVRATLRF